MRYVAYRPSLTLNYILHSPGWRCGYNAHQTSNVLFSERIQCNSCLFHWPLGDQADWRCLSWIDGDPLIESLREEQNALTHQTNSMIQRAVELAKLATIFI